MSWKGPLLRREKPADESEGVVLDMDSTENPVHGQQEGSADNGHFESTCRHPLLLFSQHGDCLAAKPRPGNVHSAEDRDELLLPEIHEAFEGRDVDYVIGIPANKSLACISHHKTAGARDMTARTLLRLLAVLEVLFKYTCARRAARASS
ncbi:MAG: transposase [Bryobacterales bacterium]|nr:transposase [Bryobacterales bacterium]